MKKLLAESLNEWKLFNRKQQRYDKLLNAIDDNIDPIQDVHDNAQILSKIFSKVYKPANPSGLGRSAIGRQNIALLADKIEYNFQITKSGKVFYNGTDSFKFSPEFLGNINDEKTLAINLKKALK